MAAAASPVYRVSWAQALAWRMGRHHLVERAPADELVRVAGDLCGLHAQLTSSAALSLWARIDGLEPGALDESLWTRRGLVKLWAMRGTLHLLPAAELGLWPSALGTHTSYGNRGHPKIDALSDAVGRILAERVLTREELAVAVEQVTGSPELAEWVRFSWGSYLKAAAFRGLICFAPSAGGRARFTTPATWVPGGIEKLDPAEALREVTRRYLGAYAPATAENLALWWGGSSPTRGRRMLAAVGDEVVEVEVEGQRVWVLARDADAMARTEAPDVARLLPAFDPWVVGASRRAEALLASEYRARVYRPQGWISPVVLIAGRMAGVWRHARKGRRLWVEVEPFGRLPVWARAQVEVEAKRLAAFLDGALDLNWA